MTFTERSITTAEADSESPVVTWLRRNGVVVGAVVLIALQLWWKAELLRHSYFAEDDFEYVIRAAEHGLGWDYLMRSHAGHLMPGGFALAWVLTHIQPYSWVLTCAVTLTLQACAGLALLSLLRLLFGTRPVILAPLVVYLFTPLTVPATVWWAAALNVIPFQIALPMALASHVRYVRDGRFQNALAAAGWVLFGLAFFLKAAFIPLVLFAVTSAYLVEGRWRRAAWETLRRQARAWVLYGSLLVVYVVVYLLQRHTSEINAQLPSSPWTVVRAAWTLLVRTFLPGALGGPWEWLPSPNIQALAATPTVLVVASAAVTAALVAASVWYRRNAWRAWVLLLGYVVVVDAVPASLGRLYFWGTAIGLETRYVSDAAPMLALCLGLAFIPLIGEQRPYRRPLPSGAAVPALCGLLIGAFLIGSVWSVNAFRDGLRGGDISAYVRNADAALDGVSGTTEIYNAKVPTFVMQPTFGEYALASRVLGPLVSPEARQVMEKKPPYHNPMILDGYGRLRPMDVVGAQSGPGPGRPSTTSGCWTATGSTVTIPLPVDVVRGEWMVRIGYLAGRTAAVRIWFGDERVAVDLNKGLGQVYVRLRGGGSRVQVTSLTPNVRICVGDVTVGVPQPRPGT